MNLKHILILSDLSPEALRPFAPVTALARKVGASVTLLNIVQDLQIAPHGAPFAPAVSSPDLEKEVAHARLALEEQRDALGGSGLEIQVEIIASKDIPKGIVAWAEQHEVDLIAISTHGRTGLRHLALGSVAENVIRHSPIPVLTFHRPHA